MRLRPPTVRIPMYLDAYVDLPGGVKAPKRIEDATFTYLENDSDDVVLTVTVDAEMAAGEPVCTRMVLVSGSQQLTKGLLSKLDPRWFATYTLSIAGMTPLDDSGKRFTPDSESVGELLAGVPRRRSTDKSRLTEVAEAFRHGGAEGVRRECHVGRSQAYRLVREARLAGYLPAVEQ